MRYIWQARCWQTFLMVIRACKMYTCIWLFGFAFAVNNVWFCEGEYIEPDFRRYELMMTKAIPFPTCRADDLECLRRGLRTFFFLMDSGHLGMKPVDPTTINSVTVALPDLQMSFLLRNLNVTGARWTRLVARRFDLVNDRSGVIFNSDLHVTGDVIMTVAERLDPIVAKITMDIQGVETNITYTWRGQRGIDNYDYILLGQERIAVRNTKLPSFFLEPMTEDAAMIDMMFQMKQSIIDHLANEITASLMHSIVDNFRLFARIIPVHQYYKLYI